MEHLINSTLKTAVLVVADTHINSTVSLCPRTINLDDGGTYRASRTQRWLWSCWTDFWARVQSDATGYRKILVLNGDLGELDSKHRSVQLITQNKSTILGMVREVLEVASWDALYIVRGTRAHVGSSAWLEEEIGKDFDAVSSDINVHSWWQIRASVEGVKFDIAHHAPMGKLPWTRVNSAVKMANIALWSYVVERGIKSPDEVIRSHNHIFADASVGNTHACFTPCWSAITEYGYRSNYGDGLPMVGGIVYYCENGERSMKKYFYEPERERRIWQMKL